MGDYEEALATIDRDSARGTVMVLFYRAAATAALEKSDEALDLLEAILDNGFRDFVTLEASPYFEVLRIDPRYQELIAQYKD